MQPSQDPSCASGSDEPIGRQGITRSRSAKAVVVLMPTACWESDKRLIMNTEAKRVDQSVVLFRRVGENRRSKVSEEKSNAFIQSLLWQEYRSEPELLCKTGRVKSGFKETVGQNVPHL